MVLFRKNCEVVATPPIEENAEVKIQETANKKAEEKVMQSTNHLYNLLEENGFHLLMLEAVRGEAKNKGEKS